MNSNTEMSHWASKEVLKAEAQVHMDVKLVKMSMRYRQYRKGTLSMTLL